MGAVKILSFIYVSFIFLVIGANVFYADTAYYKIEKTLNQALDAAIIDGSVTDDAMRGYVRLDEDLARGAAREILIKTLNLDSGLENSHFKSANFTLQIEYLGDTPRIEAEYRAQIDFFAGKLVGLNGYELTVKKRTPYLSLYK